MEVQSPAICVCVCARECVSPVDAYPGSQFQALPVLKIRVSFRLLIQLILFKLFTYYRSSLPPTLPLTPFAR